jgi:hypothetical protein
VCFKSKTIQINRHSVDQTIDPTESNIGPSSRIATIDSKLLHNYDSTRLLWLIHIAKCGFPGIKDQLLDSVEILVNT